MAISLVGAGVPFEGSTTSITAVVVPYPTGVQVGDLLLMQVVSSVTANPTTPTGWAVFEPNLQIGSPGPTHITYFKWADAADTSATSVTLTAPTGKYEGQMVAYRGVDPTTPKDVTAPTGTQSATATLAVPPPITTVTPGAVVILFAGANTASGVTTAAWSSTNMTERVEGSTRLTTTTNPTAAIYDTTLASPGTFQPDVTVTSSGRSSMRVVALRPASAPVIPQATAGGTFTFSGAAVGKRTPKATAGGTFAYSGSAVGLRPTGIPKATAGGTFTFTGSAVGKRTPKATAGGTFTFSSSAVGTAPVNSGWSTPVTVSTLAVRQATAGGTFTFSGAAVGKRVPRATAGGTFTFSGSAVGKRKPKAVAGGTITFSGTALGKRARSATAGGTFTFTGSAVGGTLSGAEVWTGLAWKAAPIEVWTGTAWKSPSLSVN